jgi:DNA-binding Lrp family transcriptional regulator
MADLDDLDRKVLARYQGDARVSALDREGTTELRAFADRMRACPVVQQCFYVTGPFDFIAIVVVADMAAYHGFTREHLLSDPNVKSFTTHVAFSRVMGGLGLAIA